jgi:murein DD-endopeptidase MepM/ murein hydrolase activator NlpD
MNRPNWSILIVKSGTDRRVRRLPYNTCIAVVVLIFILAGSLGLGRCVYFAGSYGLAKLGMYYDLKKNIQLKRNVLFFSKLTEDQKRLLEKYINFEDKTRMKFGLDPISSDIRKVGVGGRPELSEITISSFEDPEIRKTDTIKDRIQTLLRQANLEDTTFSAMSHAVDKQINIWAQRPAVMPVWGRQTSSFGYRIHPFTGENVFHEGIDISNTIGTPVLATADGVISFVGYKDYFGNVVMVMHPASGFKTVFAHLFRAAVAEGQAVKRGDIVGYLGTSGRSTGPHLHYEVHKLGDIVNPVDYFLPTDTMVD